YALFAFPIGILADKIGLKKMLIFGIGIFSIVYGGMGFNHNRYLFFGLFALYGIYAAASEGISKAWISNISKEKDTATAIGNYSAFQSFFTMLASSLAGLIWYQFGADVTFIVTAFASILIGLYFIFMTTEKSII
ncbi:MAG: MFS family permease, partial [Flavobacterium sp.]